MKKLSCAIFLILLLSLIIPAANIRVVSAQPAQLILFWDDNSSTPPGWTCISNNLADDFFELFLRGAPTYGDTGGTLTHTHTATVVSCSTPSATTQCKAGALVPCASPDHTHTSATTLSASNVPLRRGLRIIRCDTGIPATIPAGAIALFDSEPLPPGWTRYSAQDGYYVQGVAIAGVVLGSNTHDHIVSTGGPSATVNAGIGLVGVANGGHVHSGTSDMQSNEPPYIEIIFAQADSDTTIPPGMIGMFNEFPEGCWTVISDVGGDLYHRFIKGSGSYGATGGTDSHTHGDLTITTSPLVPFVVRTSGPGTNIQVASQDHTHANLIISFSTESNLPPYRDVIFAKLGTLTAEPWSNSPVCEGSTINLFGNPDGMSSYNWYGPGGWTSTDRNPTRIADNTTAGTYYLSVVNSHGCTSDNATVNVIVNPLPAVDAGDNLEVCQYADPIDLDNTGESPSGGTWSGPGVSDSQFDPDDLAAGDYSIIYSYTNHDTGCSNSDNKTVTINSLPYCNISCDPVSCSACFSNNVTLTEDGGDALSWLWSTGETTQSIMVNNSGTYSVTITDQNGCHSTCNKEVTINPLPDCTITAPAAVCANSTGNFASVPDAGVGSTYAWSVTNGNITGGQGTSSITWDAGSNNPATIGIVITDANGCLCSNNVDITINPVPTATASSNSPVCIGDTIQLTGGPDDMDSYSWTGPDGFTSDQQSPSIFNASMAMAGTYYLNVTKANCTSDNTSILVNVIDCGGGGITLGETTAPTVTACSLTLTVNMLGKVTTAKMTSEGVLCEDCMAFDPSKQNSWEAKAGTKLTLVDNQIPKLIKVTLAGSSPPAGNAQTIGPTYAMNAYASLNSTIPSAINIYPLFSMSSAYDPNGLPRNTSEVIYSYYPGPTQGWLAMGSQGVVAEVGEARGTMTYFLPDTLLVKLAEITPAKFEASNLAINPSQISPDQQITISLNVTNTGGTSGDYTVELKVDGIVKSSKQVTLVAGGSQTVSFTITEASVGRYQVEIAGLDGEFVVSGPSKFNWWPIVGIIGAVILVLAIWILIRWRRFSGY
jgi:hypothetical protein